MKNLCEIRDNDVFTTSLKIADGTNVEHRAVMQLIRTHSGTEILSTFEMSKVSRGGRPVEYALLNELQATFLVTLMRNSQIVVSFKEKLTKEFFRQRKIIAQLSAQQSSTNWQSVRDDGKIVYSQKIDVIKKFVEYATAQGSKNARNYYANLAKMENSALFFFEQKYPNVREVLTIKQLMQVATADDVIEKALDEGMEKNLPYKECYKLAKERIIAFSNIIGRSPVHNLVFKI